MQNGNISVIYLFQNTGLIGGSVSAKIPTILTVN